MSTSRFLNCGLLTLLMGVLACSGSKDNPFAGFDTGGDPDTGTPPADVTDTTPADTAPTDTDTGSTDTVADTETGDTAADADTVEVVDPFCGDGTVDEDEECDDGNNEDFDGCDALCLLEVCERGNDTDGDEIDDCDDVEECDGVDNNGNGAVDEFPVDETIGDDCYTGPEGTLGVGICRAGEMVCRLGEIVCVGDVTPQFDELCNDLDDDCNGAVPPEEIELGCSTDIVVTPTPFTARFEVATPPRAVDVALNIDTTGSMAGVLDGIRTDLRDVIVPGVQTVLPDAAFAVSTFEDFPFGEFGLETDLPFELFQRVTSDVDAVQTALNAIELGNGNDTPESGIESLFQIGTGEGVGWPVPTGGVEGMPFTDATLAEYGESSPDVDDYVVGLDSGAGLRVEVASTRVGGGLDSYLRVYSSSGELLVSNDDSSTLDSLVVLEAPETGDYIVRVSTCCSGAPSWGGGTGWYALGVSVDGDPYVADADTCSELELDEDTEASGPVSTEGLTRLVPSADRTVADHGACVDDCRAITDVAASAIGVFCGHGAGECGDGVLDDGEECDDGNVEAGDGCAPDCTAERVELPAFDPRPGFSTSLGHGRLGGVGFRAGAVPVIVHATDAPSHAAVDYTGFLAGVTAHDAVETFEALDEIGARVIGIASSTGAVTTTEGDLRYVNQMVARTDSIVPLCAFDGSDARVGDACSDAQCCTGIGGVGEPPNDDGECPLVFRVSGSGTGLSTAIVQGIQALASFRGEPITARIVAADGVTERAECLVSSIAVTDVVRPGDCLPELELADLDDDGLPETVLNATPSTRATFTFTAVNKDTRDVDGDEDTEEPCLDPGSYALTFQLLDASEEVIFAMRVSVTIPDA